MISCDTAKKMLLSTYTKIAYLPQNRQVKCNHSKFIDYVLSNTHKTYKYIMFTAILAKATDEQINPICLQKGSKLPGAYDARSICHSVIVPFEMNQLGKCLGGSNEPFLNKPARYPELSSTNAVRKGKDAEILSALIKNLPMIRTSQDAQECLAYLIKRLLDLKQQQENQIASIIVSDSGISPFSLKSFFNKLLELNYEGEMLTLVIAGTYFCLFCNKDERVEVHPVNQSGASGKEVSDLDIYKDNLLIVSNEIKDKPYHVTDVQHATDKVLLAGGNKLLFIEGPRAKTTEDISSLINQYNKKGFFLSVINYQVFIDVSIAICPKINFKAMVTFLVTIAHETKFKDESIQYLLQTIKAFS